MSDAFETVSAFGNPDFHRRRHFLMIGFNNAVLFRLPGTQSGLSNCTEKLDSCQALKNERIKRMTLTSEVRRNLVEHLAGRQWLIGEQVVFAIRSSGEIFSSERLTDQQLIDHFPQLFADLAE
jgi:hypothetical protein